MDARGELTVDKGVLAISRGLALAAPSEHILISPEVRTILEDFFHYEGMGSIYIRGVATPLEAYRVIGRNSREGRWHRSRMVRRSRMVGRDEELRHLEDGYNAARHRENWIGSGVQG